MLLSYICLFSGSKTDCHWIFLGLRSKISSIICGPHCKLQFWWFSGKILACHTGGLGSIFGQYSLIFWGFQVMLVVKSTPANAGGRERCGFDSWLRKIPWGRKWLPTLVFLSGESHGQRSLVGSIL